MGEHSLVVPSLLGGAVEELTNYILANNEKYEIYIIQKDRQIENFEIIFNKTYNAKFNKLIVLKENKIKNFFVRGINLFFRIFKSRLRVEHDYLKKAYKKIVKINPDYVIVENFYSPNLKWLSEKIGQKKMILHIHSVMKNYSNLEKVFSKTICVSEFVKTDLEQKIGINKVQSFVLKNAINYNMFNKKLDAVEKSKLKKQYNIGEEDFVFIYAGRIVPEKGVLELLKAFSKLDQDNAKLMIVGSSNFLLGEKTPYFELLKPYINEKVIFTGYIEYPNLYKYYQLADAQVLPTIIDEAAGMVLIEGRTAGLFQIASRKGGICEYVSPNNSLLVEVDDNFETNLCDAMKVALTRKNKSCEKFFENNEFSSLEYYKNFVKIVEDLINE